MDKYQNSLFYLQRIKVINTSGSGFTHDHTDRNQSANLLDKIPKLQYNDYHLLNPSPLFIIMAENKRQTIVGSSTNPVLPNHCLESSTTCHVQVLQLMIIILLIEFTIGCHTWWCLNHELFAA